MNQRFSVYNFDDQNKPFCFSKYSKLKFGCDKSAQEFGTHLAQSFFKAHSDSILVDRAVVIPSPYNYVPNAATVLTRHFVRELNHLVVHRNGEPVEYSTINRKVSYVQDYGFLKAEQRKGLIDNDVFYLNPEFYQDKTLIFVDDVRITGTHENKLEELLDQRNIKNSVFYLYIGDYSGNRPEIESELNFASVKNIHDYINIAKGGAHMIVRPIKYILGASESDRAELLKSLHSQQLNALYYGILGDGLYKIPQYQKAFGQIKSFMGKV